MSTALLGAFPRVLRNSCTLPCVLILLALTTSPAGAQSLGAGSIEGTITDESKAAMPGVAITATSPALQVPQVTVVSGADGAYRFASLPAGIYQLKYELTGFQTIVRQELRLIGGFVATVNVELKVGALEESLTVIGESPVVDVKTTAGQTNFTKELLETIPVARTMWNVFAMAPGIRVSSAPDVGGNTTGFQQGYSNYGVSGQNTPMLEGINTREGTSAAGFFYDFGSFEEVQVKALGSGADVATSGTNFVGIVKSGGNEFHGRYLAAGQTEQLQSSNIDDDLRARGVTEGDRFKYFYDLSGDLGGRIIRNKLWFYGSLVRQQNNKTLTGYSKEQGPDKKWGTADDVQGYEEVLLTNESLKLSYQPTAKHKVIGFYAHNAKTVPEWFGSRTMPFPTTHNYTFPPTAWKGEYQSTPTNNVLVNVLGGYVWYWANYPGQNTANGPGNPSTFDLFTGMNDGPNREIWFRFRKHWQTSGSAVMFGAFGGQHSLKVGYSADWEHLGIDRPNKPSGNYYLTFDNGAPLQITTYNLPINGHGSKQNSYGLYVQDTWTIGRRLTLNLGLRAERYDDWVDSVTKPQGTFGTAGTFPRIAVETWNGLVPRLGLAFDVTGDAKTVVKATYGVFNYNLGVDFADGYNANSLQSTVYRWRDLNGNRDYDPGEVNLDLQGSDFISTSGAVNTRLNPDLRQPITQEISASFEREVAANFSVRALYVHKTLKDFYSTVNVARPYSAWDLRFNRQDPGPDGILGSADDGGFVDIYDYNAAYRGSAFVANMPTNRSGNDDNYQTIELTAVKRRSSNLDLLGSFSATKNHRYLTGNVQTPNDEIFNLDTTWNWQAKVSASYTAPYDIHLAAFYQAISGAPGQRTYVFRNLPQSGTLNIRMEPYGAHALPTLQTVNIRIGKILSRNPYRLELSADLYNALNANTITATSYVSGATFNAVNAIMLPRIVRLGAALSF
jgi:hypothetical protein